MSGVHLVNMDNIEILNDDSLPIGNQYSIHSQAEDHITILLAGFGPDWGSGYLTINLDNTKLGCSATTSIQLSRIPPIPGGVPGNG